MNVRKIKLWPKSTMKSASNGNELSDDRSVLKHCVSEIHHSNPFPKSSTPPPENPPGMVNTMIWSNPTFWRSDEAEGIYDVGSNDIDENKRQKDLYGFCVPTPSSLVFSFNLSLEGKGPPSSEVARSNPRRYDSTKPEGINEVVCEEFPKNRSEVRNAGRMSEAEANIRAELAREIEKELELELEQQIAILTCRLQNLRAHRKSEIPVNGPQSFSLQKKALPQNHNNNNSKAVDRGNKSSALRSGSGGSFPFRGFCGGVDVLTQSGPSRQIRRVGNGSTTNSRVMKRK
ncbi:hypothetical protein SUGI_1170440 [Cryptomeria japonica]|uniref:uncharacterized protein LOC131032453 n=1 Tax=Cryptomeria japonica TaxID=3369 RepID=UPI00241482BF|nr:uncharacterized protein LOC131032453 [Cryptomeria japonica]GLJ54494.1 hypothetical protein SUGI_1170440 [Cryptomeria japonica]